MSEMIELPDFAVMEQLLDEITSLSIQQARLKTEIELTEARVVLEATTDPKWFGKDSKPQTQTFINNTWRITGFNGELENKRIELADITALLTLKKSKLDMLKIVIDVWRTQSANERKATF